MNIWTAITPMGTKRSCLGICAFDGLIYVCGGYDGASCLSSMERFDPLTGIWCSCPAMNTRRRYCRVAVVGKHSLCLNVQTGRLWLRKSYSSCGLFGTLRSFNWVQRARLTISPRSSFTQGKRARRKTL